MTWEEVDGADWTLPAARNKTKLDLVRPFSTAAQAVLDELREHRIDGCRYVFSTDGKRPLSGFGKFKKKFDTAAGVTGWTLHDCRRTARSLLSRAGVSSDHAEQCLGHIIPGVRGTYDRHAYYDEKKCAYEALAAQIDRIVNPQDNVTALRRRRH
jgi:integrase